MTGKNTNGLAMCTSKDRKALKWVIKTLKYITGTHLPSNSDISEVRCLHKALNMGIME